ncbi:uncharacterized protein N7515_000007 [Penicillium bovifimosum]|uniref:Uncharacterized protein n=1 Tax=Penicillium bovifimosum TaxID=126998 RepID=A0A9W9HEN0_9EURO|nr:uncharacterized protein N7515_000007 [Penicillium bovifimosum]KAJ5145443.1 hypothetical protein N7515_000007 [Penicillium bovifimosum]
MDGRDARYQNVLELRELRQYVGSASTVGGADEGEGLDLDWLTFSWHCRHCIVTVSTRLEQKWSMEAFDWNGLSRDTQGKIAAQVAEMIQEMHSIELLQPGPTGGGPCRGRFFTDYSAGPFMDTAEMEAWFNHKLDICKSVHQAPK